MKSSAARSCVIFPQRRIPILERHTNTYFFHSEIHAETLETDTQYFIDAILPQSTICKTKTSQTILARNGNKTITEM